MNIREKFLFCLCVLGIVACVVFAIDDLGKPSERPAKCAELASKLDSEYHVIDDRCYIKGYGKIKAIDL
ncbi:hypothetical protein PS2_115 [Serratia phage PS2]|uniref:Uncharacterized protein n=1 Tax=Serratia phage PS2 TaxID=1481112 RepID=A0A023W6A7_9CAUD|nr:hypothetical protein FF83_gp115 [Serratia phage PS2]AHY25361.1 hypothetical protein PS2_115 [Serratia phage PS2]